MTTGASLMMLAAVKPASKRCTVEEGLEVGAGLALCLGGAVELALFETHAADNTDDGAVVRVQ